MKTRKEKRELGYQVSKSIRKIVEEQVEAVRAENKILISKMDSYDSLLAMLKRYDLVDEQGNPVSRYSMEAKIRRLRDAIPDNLLVNINHTLTTLKIVQDGIAEILGETQ